MTGEDFLNVTRNRLNIIEPTERVKSMYQEIQKSLKSFEVIDNFEQLKKNDKGEGLALEIMLLDKKQLIDIVCSGIGVTYTTLYLKAVTMVTLDVISGMTSDEKGEKNSVDELTLNIYSQSDSSPTIYYSSDSSRFNDFLRIRNNIQALL